MLSIRLKWQMVAVCVAWAPLLLSGCSRDNSPVRYAVAGNVTFAGKPVPAGSILFSPELANEQGNVAGFATIKNGKYDTSDGGKGVVGGRQIVTISGFDGIVLPDSELTYGRPLFPSYRTKADLPKEKTTYDVDVPASTKRLVAR